jgi:hypothetical protein
MIYMRSLSNSYVLPLSRGNIKTPKILMLFSSSSSYPADNCSAQFGLGDAIDPQQIFPSYLTHNSGKGIVAPYLNSSGIARAAGKPFITFKTTAASCGGFPGVSDSFGAAGGCRWFMPYDVLWMARYMTDPIRMLVKRDELTLVGIKWFFVAVEKENWMFDALCVLYDTLNRLSYSATRGSDCPAAK